MWTIGTEEIPLAPYKTMAGFAVGTQATRRLVNTVEGLRDAGNVEEVLAGAVIDFNSEVLEIPDHIAGIPFYKPQKGIQYRTLGFNHSWSKGETALLECKPEIKRIVESVHLRHVAAGNSTAVIPIYLSPWSGHSAATIYTVKCVKDLFATADKSREPLILGIVSIPGDDTTLWENVTAHPSYLKDLDIPIIVTWNGWNGHNAKSTDIAIVDTIVGLIAASRGPLRQPNYAEMLTAVGNGDGKPRFVGLAYDASSVAFIRPPRWKIWAKPITSREEATNQAARAIQEVFRPEALLLPYKDDHSAMQIIVTSLPLRGDDPAWDDGSLRDKAVKSALSTINPQPTASKFLWAPRAVAGQDLRRNSHVPAPASRLFPLVDGVSEIIGTIVQKVGK